MTDATVERYMLAFEDGKLPAEVSERSSRAGRAPDGRSSTSSHSPELVLDHERRGVHPGGRVAVGQDDLEGHLLSPGIDVRPNEVTARTLSGSA